MSILFLNKILVLIPFEMLMLRLRVYLREMCRSSKTHIMQEKDSVPHGQFHSKKFRTQLFSWCVFFHNLPCTNFITLQLFLKGNMVDVCLKYKIFGSSTRNTGDAASPMHWGSFLKERYSRA